jgi:Peptidase MA superfamily
VSKVFTSAGQAWSIWRYCRLGTVIAALILGLAAPLGPVSGQGGDIRVLSNHHEVNFPDVVTFNLTAEAENEIVEVRLNYRIAGSRVLTYTYPHFTPGRRIAANYNGLISEAGYLPPGARIAYYYSIRDSSGNHLQTPWRVLEYTDTRFQWEQTQVGPLTLFHHDVSQSKTDALARELAVELGLIHDLLQLEEQQRVRGFIYNKYAEAVPAFPLYSRTLTEEEVFHGFAFPSHDVFVGVGLQPRLIVHETAHLLLAQKLESEGRPIPSWLDEGFATYVEPDYRPYSGQSLSSQGPPLRAMSALSGSPQDINYFYLKSASVVAYLIEEHGVVPFQQFLEELRQGRSVGGALLSVYGFDADGLEGLWSDSNRGRAAPSPGSGSLSSPFLLFNTWFLSGLVLAVMALLLIRYAIGKLRPSDDPEEGLQPWEDPDP